MTANDFTPLEKMIYCGRGIVLGNTPNGNPFVGYILTGRSRSSQARKLVQGQKTGIIRTEVTDIEQFEKGNPALLLYPAIIPINSMLIAGNGAQTKLIYSTAREERPSAAIILDAFKNPSLEYDPNTESDRNTNSWTDLTTFEPDPPNNTPRISGCLIKERGALYIVRKGADGKKEEEIFPEIFKPGEGKLLTTYRGGNENPLEPFTGKPLAVGIGSNSAEEIAGDLYAAIKGGAKPEDDYRVAAAAVVLNLGNRAKTLETAIINRCNCVKAGKAAPLVVYRCEWGG